MYFTYNQEAVLLIGSTKSHNYKDKMFKKWSEDLYPLEVRSPCRCYGVTNARRFLIQIQQSPSCHNRSTETGSNPGADVQILPYAKCWNNDSHWVKEVKWLRPSNQRGLFQHSSAMLCYNLMLILVPYQKVWLQSCPRTKETF